LRLGITQRDSPVVIALLTDFGSRGPYVGEMMAVLARLAPEHPRVELISDLPLWDPIASAYLVDPLVRGQPRGTVFVVVVDPGVGTESRRAVWLEADGRVLVGPDNGVLEVVARGARVARMHEILWRPGRLSASFHGRDLFAPVAARLARGEAVASRAIGRRFAWSRRWPRERERIIYLDGYGNCMTGLRAQGLRARQRILAGGQRLRYARTFAEAAPGEAFWYRNSLGLVEIACNRARAAQVLGLEIGAAVRVESPLSPR
jgi:S-adenosylmethionine hydrolase